MSELLRVNIRDKHFGGKRVLGPTQFAVHAGEIVALVGPSGCGKSTLLRIVAQLERDYSGDVTLDGKTLNGLTRDIGFVFQEPRLFPWLTVAENIAFDLGKSGAKDSRVDTLLAEVGLAGFADALPKSLSGGQAQRVAMARGLFTQPKLLLLDEPFSAVDAFTRMRLQDLLLKLAAQHHITVLLVTHDVDEAIHLSDRVIVIGGEPGGVAAEIAVDAPRPRERQHEPAATQEARNALFSALHAAHVF
jgi:sulfonate transport system ATP-binding protein